MKKNKKVVLATLPLAIIIILFVFTQFSVISIFPSVSAQDSEVRVIDVRAFQFGWEPEIIHIDTGEQVIFRIEGDKVVAHGFYIDGKDFYVYIPPLETVDVGPMVFDTPGKLKVRCSETCGPLHPFMVADIIIEPNFPYYTFLLSALAVGAVTVVYVQRGPKNKMLGVSLDKEVDLLRVRGIGPILKKALQWRGIHFALIWPNVVIFMIVLASGFFGNPTGNLNFSVGVVWILWLTAVEYMILFAGRTWCTLCPLPAFGEWIARRRIYGVHKLRKPFSLDKKFPKSLNNMWGSALGFLGISLVVPWLVTRPWVSGLLFLALIILGVVFTLVYTRRYFCRVICPANSYIGYHANASFYAVRSVDKSTCDKHIEKECMRGGPKGYACPWVTPYPGGLTESTWCGQCYECVKSCPLDNMSVKYRMIGKDIANMAVLAKRRFGMAWVGFIRFNLGIFYELVFFGSFWALKDWGNMGIIFGVNLFNFGVLSPTTSAFQMWLVWAVIVAGVSLVAYPAVFFVFTSLAKMAAGAKNLSTKNDVFVPFTYALAPYGLFIWLAFTLNLILVNWAYPLSRFSDPMGWGWESSPIIPVEGLKAAWNPIAPELLPYILMPIVLIGLALAINSTYNIAVKLFGDQRMAFRSTAVMAILHTGMALFFAWIIIG